MALLVLAGWFAQSLANVARVDLGFRAESLAVFSIAPERNGYARDAIGRAVHAPRGGARADPGRHGCGRIGRGVARQQQLGCQRQRRRLRGNPRNGHERLHELREPGVLSDARDAAGSRRGIRARHERRPACRRRQRTVRREVRARRRAPSASAWRSAPAETLDIEIVGVVRDAKYSEVKADRAAAGLPAARAGARSSAR